MKLSTGGWVSGADFFDRESELRLLQGRVLDHNHVLLTGQRRMGKTSLVRELGRNLEDEGWVFLFADVEGATCPEDVVAEIANAAHPVRSIASRFINSMAHVLDDAVEEVSAMDFRVKIRAGMRAGTWRRYGDQLLRECAAYDKPVLLVIDELPIFLTRLLRNEGAHRVDEFLSWLRSVLQGLGSDSPVLIVSGSIGLVPLVQRLNIPDRINHLDPFRLGPWSREASIACFRQLARSYSLEIGHGVPAAVYDALGVGIPHHVQSFFARLREYAITRQQSQINVGDVAEVYRTALLGPSGQNDLVHYETRLRECLDDQSHTIAIEILADAAIQDVFTPDARRSLERWYSATVDDVPRRTKDVLEVLVHDGYLEHREGGYFFPSRLLKDWWSARFREHHTPIEQRALAKN